MSPRIATDGNGNLTTDETGKQYVYDAWDRLVTVKSSGGATRTSYQYDALFRRVVENSGTARDLYYSAAWQVLEERKGGVAKAQYVWSPRKWTPWCCVTVTRTGTAATVWRSGCGCSRTPTSTSRRC